MTLSGVTIHAVILSYCHSSKYSIRGDSEAQQQEVQLQQTTLQSEGRVTPAFFRQNWADIQPMTLLDWPLTMEQMNGSTPVIHLIMEWCRLQSECGQCQRWSTAEVSRHPPDNPPPLSISWSPQGRGDSSSQQHNTKKVSSSLPSAGPSNYQHNMFSFQNVSTIVRSCYTSHHDTSSLAKCPKPWWWW